MKISFTLNGVLRTVDVAPSQTLLTVLRSLGCFSVKCGCESSNCGLCTVWMDGSPVLSCTILAARANGHVITTLEGLQDDAKLFGSFMAEEGADQCGFCNPGFIMNVLAMPNELKDPSEEEINEYLSGNYCRCTGYSSQMRAIKAYLKYKKEGVR